MAEGLIPFLGRDLRRDLAAGGTRVQLVSHAGDRRLGLWALTCFLVGAILFVIGGYHAGFVRLNAMAAQLPGWAWQSLTVLGDERVAFAMALFFARRYPQVLWALVIAALIGTAYTHSVKPLVGALRPPAVLGPDTFNLLGPVLRRASFPSGHSVTAAVYCGVWVYYLQARLVRALLIVLAVAVGLSRVAVGVHWPVDVAAGLTGGALAAWAGVTLARRSRWGGLDPWVHLVVVALAVGFASGLIVWDRGYHSVAWLQMLIGIAALVSAGLGYVLTPGIRWWREWRDTR
jgi:membrane-associated phospholipid phosphatase